MVIILRLIGMTIAVSSMTAYALARVSDLVNAAVAAFPANLTPDLVQKQSELAYFDAGIRAIDELLLIGAIACLIAIVPALVLRGRANDVPGKLADSAPPSTRDVLSTGI